MGVKVVCKASTSAGTVAHSPDVRSVAKVLVLDDARTGGVENLQLV